MQQDILLYILTGLGTVTLGAVSLVWSEVKGIRNKTDDNSVAIATSGAKLDSLDARVDRLPCKACK